MKGVFKHWQRYRYQGITSIRYQHTVMYFYTVYCTKTTDNVNVSLRECPECWWWFLVKVIKLLHLLTNHSKNGCMVLRLKTRKLHNSQNQDQWNYNQYCYWCTTVGCSCVLSKPQYKVCAFRCCIYRKHHGSEGSDEAEVWGQSRPADLQSHKHIGPT